MAEDQPPCMPAPGDEAVPSLRIEAVMAEPERAVRFATTVPAGTRLGDVLESLRGALGAQGAPCEGLEAAVFGKRRDADYLLHDGDRIEFLRPLTADPKLARQRRVQKRREAAPRDKWRGA